MRKLGYVLLLLLSSSIVNAQKLRFGNEWINYDQTYYRIPVTEGAVLGQGPTGLGAPSQWRLRISAAPGRRFLTGRTVLVNRRTNTKNRA